MGFRVSMLVMGLLVLNVIVVEAQVMDNDATGVIEESGQSTTNLSEQPAENLEQPLPIPVPDEASMIESVVAQLHLNTFEAAMGDLSSCGDDAICLKRAKKIKSWICAAAVCDGTDTRKKPVDCFERFFSEYSKEVQDQINALICSLIESPSAETRTALLSRLPDGTKEGEDGMVRHGAYLFALKGSAASCENYIKDYVGPDGGPQWKDRWYSTLLGCRILSNTTTREQEEAEFRRQVTSTVTEIPPASASPAYDKQ